MNEKHRIYGQHDAATIQQLERCVAAEDTAIGVLCADGHKGYSMPIGGVVAYTRYVSPSGVGFDIACGNMAVRTNLTADSFAHPELEKIADEIQRRISFGVGRRNNEPIDSPVLDEIAHAGVRQQRALAAMAASQLGTVGSGNHYVDILEDEGGRLWIACHFGSRGFGHKTATGFMSVAQGRRFEDAKGEGSMDSPPLLLDINRPSGQDYVEAMALAGRYAYAGREAVIAKTLAILGATADDHVHNHHNFAWRESHGGRDYWVVRKGATPAFPGQLGFVGGSMGDISVVLRGVESEESKLALYSTVHGAGRVMSRTQAAGKRRWRNRGAPAERLNRGAVDFDAEKAKLAARGIILRGAGADEAPPVYRPLQTVLDAHAATIEVLHVLKPRIVVMAGTDEFDPYKD